jgi:hypothetical protein
MLKFGDDHVFFHIPRCGGNYTIRTVKGLRKGGSKVKKEHFGHRHGGPLNCRRSVKKSFVIIRDPLDWYASFYRFRIFKHYGKRDMEPGHPLDFFIWRKAGGDIFGFDYFCNKVATTHPWGYVTEMFCRFFPFVTTFLWLPELTTSLPRLFADWGYDRPVSLPPKPKNASPKDIDIICSQRTKDKVHHAERAIYNYISDVARNGQPYIYNMEI